MITTIAEYYKNGGTIFDSALITYEYMTSGIITALDNILKFKYGKNNLFTDDETDIKAAVNAMFLVNNDRYTALYNVDKLIDPENEYKETRDNTGTQKTDDTGTQTDLNTGTQIRLNSGTQTTANTGTQTTANTGTQKTENTGTQSNANTGTSTLLDTGTSTVNDTGTQSTEVTPETVDTNVVSKNTSDSGVLRVLEQTQSSSTGSDTSTRTDALQSQRTDNLSHARTDNLNNLRTDNLASERTDDLTSTRTDALQSQRTDNLSDQRTDNLSHSRTDNLSHLRTDNLKEVRQGYNNKFANADFILNLSRNVLYDTIIEDTIKCIVIPVYNYCDLEV